MPDHLDYDALRELLDRPNRWTEDDASSVRLMIANQRRTIAEMHPKDIKGKESAKAVLVELETALQRYLEEQVRRSYRLH